MIDNGGEMVRDSGIHGRRDRRKEKEEERQRERDREGTSLEEIEGKKFKDT